jgi:predicted GIY-YIG superfamily endonuclease
MALYVVEFIDHGVKVGVTARDPQVRLAEHRRDAEAYGRTVGRTWVSFPHLEARANEKALKRLAGPGQKREYLPLSFDEVMVQAQLLTLCVLSPQKTQKMLSPIEHFINALTT